MTRRFRVVALVTLAALTSSMTTSVVFAQKAPGGPTAKDVAAAKKAFFEGLDSEKAGKWAEALLKFEDVRKVRMTPEVRFHIALCYEHVGRLVEALQEFETAGADAKTEKKESVVKESGDRIAAIKPRLAKVKMKMPKDVEGATVQIDSKAVDPAEEIALDPGRHKLEAAADKRKGFSLDMDLKEGESKSVDIALPRLEEKVVEVEEVPKPPPPPPAKSNTLAWVIGGVGVASLIGAGVFMGLRSGAISDLDAACRNMVCPNDKSGLIDSGKTYSLMTNIFAGVGIAGVGTATILLLTGGSSAPAPVDDKKPESKEKEKKEASRRTFHVLPSAPGADIAGISLRGAF